MASGFLTFLTSLTTVSVVLTSAHDRSKARSLMGWTPGLRSLVSGRVLPCGCVAGVYETWTRSLVTILDERHADCDTPGHAMDEILAIADPE